jgi:hypothetical protein
MRKILIGAVLALCFVMVSLTLVGKTLPRLADPSAARARNPSRMNRWCSLRP